jgi:hypothetical protein
MLAKSFTIALAATIALGLSAATFSPSALAADTKPATSADTGMKKASKSCAKMDKASQAYKDCKAKQAAAKKAPKDKTKM